MENYKAIAKSTSRYFRRTLMDLLRRQRGLVSPMAAMNVLRQMASKKSGAMGRCVQVNLLLTRRCNLRCSFCCVDKLSGSKNRIKEFEVDFARFKELFAHPLVAINLSYVLMGGEPLLCNDLERIVAFLKSKGRFSRIITNGLLLTGDRLKSLEKAGLSQAIISLYDTNEEYVGNFLPSVKSGVPIYLSKVLLGSDLENRYDELLDGLKVCTAPQCRGLMLSNCMSYGDGEGDVVYDDNPLLMKFYGDVLKKYPEVPVSFAYPVLRRTEGMKKKCSVPWNTVYLDAKGNLGMCCKFQAHPDGKFGNIFSADSEERMANGPAFRRLRTGLLSDRPNIPAECAGCSNLYDDCSLRMLFEKSSARD
ncbi:radical SAM protein [Fundidesulfovibrio agrisoli]|uniref:radical SAM protein n=1 Tax=Fundidesulfovibrio agrisoli TaxID=2922717 RepID=UPI001FADB729|nr:radical SAM protein [Fundidesulfovibrio agrisoli]